MNHILTRARAGAHAPPFRRAGTLPLEWRLHPGILLHYCTAEVIGVEKKEDQITLHTDPGECTLHVSLNGYRCNPSDIVQHSAAGRLEVHKKNGQGLTFYKETG